jgi:hypothetical protein
VTTTTTTTHQSIGAAPISYVQEQIMNASTAPININENATCTVRVNGQDITGIWVNREECMNWRGPIPLDRYKINTDAETTIIRKVDYFREGFLNLCSAEHFCNAAPNIVFREKIKKLKNILAQIKEIKKYL